MFSKYVALLPVNRLSKDFINKSKTMYRKTRQQRQQGNKQNQRVAASYIIERQHFVIYCCKLDNKAI